MPAKKSSTKRGRPKQTLPRQALPTQGRSLFSPENIKQTLARLKTRGIKSLGQNFLIDEKAADKMVQAAELTPSDTVLEIGPGLGALTKKLAAQARKVIAVEIDPKLSRFLESSLKAPNIKIITADFLKINLPKLISSELASPKSPNFKVVSSLPYYITWPILRLLLESRKKPQTMVFLLQDEVAEKIVGTAGKRSFQSIFAQLFTYPEIIQKVPSQSFFPEPKVKSAILRLKTRPSPLLPNDQAKELLRLAKIGFSSPRKMLPNNLSSGLKIPRETAQLWLEQAKINPKSRPENLSLNDWLRLCRSAPDSAAVQNPA